MSGATGRTVNTAYTVIDLQQGSSEWLEWRSNGIGSSDAPAIMGENPWKSSARLLSEKLGTARPSGSNPAMERGTALEPEARKRFEDMSKILVPPACLQSNRHAWQRASVDGLEANGSSVVEIKCGEGIYKKISARRQVPRYYIGQLQHILAVTGLAHMDFFCWLPHLPGIHLRVKRDDCYIARLVEAEEAFWKQLIRQRMQM